MSATFDQSLAIEIRDRGLVAHLEVEDSDGYGRLDGRLLRLQLGAAPRTEELARARGNANMADAVVHADGSVTLRTNRFATNIPLTELEVLVKIARAAASGELKPEKQPAGKAGPTEDVEVPF